MIYSIADNKGLSIFISIIIIGIIIYLSYYLIKKIIADAKLEKLMKQSKMEGVISKSEMDSIISTYISQVGIRGSFGLIYIDLDKFSKYANIFSDKEVSLIFSQIIKKIKSVLPTDVKISRYIGDEFVVMFSQKYNRDDIERYARELIEEFRRPIELYEHTSLEQTASIAVSYYPNHGNKVKDLIKSLKLVIYKVKKEGGDNFQVYSKRTFEEEKDNVDYFYEIKSAIQNNQFTLYYQPIIRIDTNEIFAVESLLRWNHPTLGVLSPNKFMPIMEETGDIYWVGLWGLEKLITTYMDWQEKGYKNIKPTINLSSKQLMYNEIALDFTNVCKKHKVKPSEIILEIEEFALFDINSNVFKNLVKLKEVGFKVAIDGYGIDFNALEQMEKMDIDAIKFKHSVLTEDKTYVADKMLETIIDFSNKNKKKLIVQDIETKSMLKDLDKYSVNFGQGYYFSKVLSYEKLLDYMKNHTKVASQVDKI